MLRSGDSEIARIDEEEDENLIGEAQEEQEDSADYVPGPFLHFSLLNHNPGGKS